MIEQKVKVVSIDKEQGVYFSDGKHLEVIDVDSSNHGVADFSILDCSDIKEQEFTYPIHIEKKYDGFSFGNKDKMYHIPCVLGQKGAEIIFNGEVVVHITSI